MRTLGLIAPRVLAAAALWMAGCREIPAPEGGVQSISALVFPSPGVVAGDTVRDSLGAAAPLSIIAYGLDNQPLDPQPVGTFVVLDTGARLEDGRFLIGIVPGDTVRVVGSVQGLQTQPTKIVVTLEPDTLFTDSTLHRQTYVLLPSDTIPSAQLAVTVQNRATTSGVAGVIVRYVIEKMPVPKPDGGASIVLMNGPVPSDRDTTDTGGRVLRSARLRINALTTFTTDTAIVSASASYRGAVIGTIQFTITYTNVPP
jgi:hypothetical protein